MHKVYKQTHTESVIIVQVSECHTDCEVVLVAVVNNQCFLDQRLEANQDQYLVSVTLIVKWS